MCVGPGSRPGLTSVDHSSRNEPSGAHRTTAISMILFLGVFLTGSTHELTAIAPALGYYFAVSMVTQEQIFRKNSISFIFSMILLSVAFFAVIILNMISS